MKLFLIRHGETVDNVAGLYAGVRDSVLTIHGVEQARRLGEYLAKTDVKLTHIFSSPLSRARKTAEAIQRAQSTDGKGIRSGKDELEICQVQDLIEQDFGYYEGKPFFARSERNKSGRKAHHDKHKDDPGFVDVESKESMCMRADTFLDEHLVPLLRHGDSGADLKIAVVSHGMFLSNLWRRLLSRLHRKSLAIAPEVTAARGSIVLEHLGGWSNTGYLELDLSQQTATAELGAGSIITEDNDAANLIAPLTPFPLAVPEDELPASAASSAPSRKVSDSPTSSVMRTLQSFTTTILAVDSKQHLVGLKRQRGGIGRLAHDESQKKLDGFFKRQKTS